MKAFAIALTIACAFTVLSISVVAYQAVNSPSIQVSKPYQGNAALYELNHGSTYE